MFNKLDKLVSNNIYFYDATNIDDMTEITWDNEAEDIIENPTVEDFKLLGTPTLLKVHNGQAKAFIGDEAIIEELGL